MWKTNVLALGLFLTAFGAHAHEADYKAGYDKGYWKGLADGMAETRGGPKGVVLFNPDGVFSTPKGQPGVAGTEGYKEPLGVIFGLTKGEELGFFSGTSKGWEAYRLNSGKLTTITPGAGKTEAEWPDLFQERGFDSDPFTTKLKVIKNQFPNSQIWIIPESGVFTDITPRYR